MSSEHMYGPAVARPGQIIEYSGAKPPPAAKCVRTTLPLSSSDRKEVPIYRGVLRYFPAAITGAARVSKIGNDKHNPGQELHHARGKSMDHADCITRHLLDLSEDFGAGVGRDENGVPQVDYIVWRAMALAQEWHEQHDGAPLAPGAKLPDPHAEIAKAIAEKRADDAAMLDAFYGEDAKRPVEYCPPGATLVTDCAAVCPRNLFVCTHHTASEHIACGYSAEYARWPRERSRSVQEAQCP